MSFCKIDNTVFTAEQAFVTFAIKALEVRSVEGVVFAIGLANENLAASKQVTIIDVFMSTVVSEQWRLVLCCEQICAQE